MKNNIYFTDLELDVIQNALAMDSSDDAERLAAMDSVNLKIGKYFNQPWVAAAPTTPKGELDV